MNNTILSRITTRVLSEGLGLSKFNQVKRHFDGVLDCRTQEDYERNKDVFLQQSTSNDDSKDEFEEEMAEDLGHMIDTSVMTGEKKNESHPFFTTN